MLQGKKEDGNKPSPVDLHLIPTKTCVTAS